MATGGAQLHRPPHEAGINTHWQLLAAFLLHEANMHTDRQLVATAS